MGQGSILQLVRVRGQEVLGRELEINVRKSSIYLVYAQLSVLVIRFFGFFQFIFYHETMSFLMAE
jgi:hypothetical protein